MKIIDYLQNDFPNITRITIKTLHANIPNS